MLFLMGWKAELWDNQTSPFVRCLEISHCLIFIGYTSAEVLKKFYVIMLLLKLLKANWWITSKFYFPKFTKKFHRFFKDFCYTMVTAHIMRLSWYPAKTKLESSSETQGQFVASGESQAGESSAKTSLKIKVNFIHITFAHLTFSWHN